MIDQQLLVPTLATSSGAPSMTIAELVALMDGESLPLIDQTLLIPTLRGRAGLPSETIADIVALASGGGAAVTTSSLIESFDIANFWPSRVCRLMSHRIRLTRHRWQVSPPIRRLSLTARPSA